MIPIEKLRSLERAYLHANCPDGTASALILKDALPNLDVRFVKYGTAEHREIEPLPNTIFCDFSPYIGDTSKGVNKEPGSVVDAWIQAGVVVLDHHSRDIVEPYPFGVFGENDKLECGAWLAYEHVWLPMSQVEDLPYLVSDPYSVEDFARLAAIRDTWKTDDKEDFEHACLQASLLLFWDFEYLVGEGLVALNCAVEEDLPRRLKERQIELAESCIKEAFCFVSDKGTRVLMFQGVSATSDAAEILDKAMMSRRAQRDELRRSGFGPSEPLDSMISAVEDGNQPDLVVGFHYRFDGSTLQLQFSTCSHTGFDCQALAKANGGNGHKAAAGFTVVAEDYDMDPYAAFRALLNDWEGGA